ncbi:hypothetical protein D9M73_106600 [compost metagenome]
MQHEVFVGQAGQAVDHLLGVLGAERGGADRLRLATREQRRAVRARQEVDDRLDRTDLRGGAAVDALAVLQDRATDDFGFELLDELLRGHLVLRGGIGKGFLGLGARGVEQVRALGLVGHLIGGGDVLADQFLELVLGGREISLSGHFPRILSSLFGQIDDEVDGFAARRVRELHGTEHDLFGKLLGFGFNHHHGFTGRGDDEIEIAFLDLVERRVEHIFAIDIADARCADRAHERHARNGQRSRGGDHGEHVGLILAIIAEHLADHVDLVVEPFGEQRADRAVDQAADQRFLFGRAALTLEEATGDAAGSRIFFLIVNGQREEILAFLHRFGGGHGAEHHGFAERCHNGTIGLARDAAGFQRQRLATPLGGHGLGIEHLFSFNTAGRMPTGPLCGLSRPARFGAFRGSPAMPPECGMAKEGHMKTAPRGRRFRTGRVTCAGPA